MQNGSRQVVPLRQKQPMDLTGTPLEELQLHGEIPTVLFDLIQNVEREHRGCPPKLSLSDTYPLEKVSLRGLHDFLNNLPKPIVPPDVTFVLLKIQEKYGTDHPFLCNSRFRHALHQLPPLHHAVLHHLVRCLHGIFNKDSNSDSDGSESARAVNLPIYPQLWNTFVPTIFGSDETAKKVELLSKILTEFISEYRAIFEIESTLEQQMGSVTVISQEETHFHEHRKRHEEEDECPEDIKAMKVAWDELSLDCNSCLNMSRENSPAKVKSNFPGNQEKSSVANETLSDIVDSDQVGVRGRQASSRTSLGKMDSRDRIDLVKTFFQPTSQNNNQSAGVRKMARTGSGWCQLSDCCPLSSNIKNHGPQSPNMRNQRPSVSSSPSTSLSPSSSCVCRRKRKERQDSISDSQDRKFSRSCSLEFPETEEDGSRTEVGSENWRSSSVSPMVEINQNQLEEQDHILQEVQEDNKKNSGGWMSEYIDSMAENFNQPLKKSMKSVGGRRCRKERCDSLKENSLDKEKNSAKMAMVQTNDREGPAKSFDIETDLATTSSFLKCFSGSPNLSRRYSSPVEGRRMNTSRPGESSWVSEHLAHMIRVDTAKETMSSLVHEAPRTFCMLNSAKHLEQNQHLVSEDRRMSDSVVSLSSKGRKHQKQLSRQLSSVKRKLDELEREFQLRTGYRMSQADKMKDGELKAMMTEQARLKKEIKAVKEKREEGREGSKDWEKSILTIRISLADITAQLEDSRADKGRPEDPDMMSLDQVLDEKLELQCHLLEYEKKHGHPETKEEKEQMKDLYERYRTVKRLARRSGSARSRDSVSELASIPEDEEISLTLASPGHRINLAVPSLAHTSTSLPSITSQVGVDCEEIAVTVSRHDMDLPDIKSRRDGMDENWHSMTRYELMKTQRKVKEEKRRLRRTVKELEEGVRSQTGKKIQKEDREPFDCTYQLYKSTKAKLKLIEALLSKQSS